MKPFLKWAGGKRKLLPEIEKHWPTSYNDYYEPFLGGGAVFFGLWSKRPGTTAQAHLSDVNNKLVRTYATVKLQPRGVLGYLIQYEQLHNKEFYYRRRHEFNNVNWPARPFAAQFIYLNKTCFNGLYRENSKGEFNVPVGKHKNPKIRDVDGILEAHRWLRCATIKCQQFDEIEPKPGDLVYFDPPYIPIGKNFTQYSKCGFPHSDQQRLAAFATKLRDQGTHVILSNSYSSLVYGLYDGWNIREIEARRSVGASAETRKNVKEVLIYS